MGPNPWEAARAMLTEFIFVVERLKIAAEFKGNFSYNNKIYK